MGAIGVSNNGRCGWSGERVLCRFKNDDVVAVARIICKLKSTGVDRVGVGRAGQADGAREHALVLFVCDEFSVTSGNRDFYGVGAAIVDTNSFYIPFDGANLDIGVATAKTGLEVVEGNVIVPILIPDDEEIIGGFGEIGHRKSVPGVGAFHSASP